MYTVQLPILPINLAALSDCEAPLAACCQYCVITPCLAPEEKLS